MALIALVATTDDDRSTFTDTLSRILAEHVGTATQVVEVPTSQPTQSAENHVPSRQADGLIARPSHVSGWRPLYGLVGATTDAQRKAVKDLLKQGPQSAESLRQAVQSAASAPVAPATVPSPTSDLEAQMRALLAQAGVQSAPVQPAQPAKRDAMPALAHSLTEAERMALATWAETTLIAPIKQTAVRSYIAGQLPWEQVIATGVKTKSALRVIGA